MCPCSAARPDGRSRSVAVPSAVHHRQTRPGIGRAAPKIGEIQGTHRTLRRRVRALRGPGTGHPGRRVPSAAAAGAGRDRHGNPGRLRARRTRRDPMQTPARTTTGSHEAPTRRRSSALVVIGLVGLVVPLADRARTTTRSAIPRSDDWSYLVTEFRWVRHRPALVQPLGLDEPRRAARRSRLRSLASCPATSVRSRCSPPRSARSASARSGSARATGGHLGGRARCCSR